MNPDALIINFNWPSDDARGCVPSKSTMEGHAKYSCHVTGILSSMPAPEFEWYSTEEDDANRRLGRFQAFMRIEYGVLRSHSYNLGICDARHCTVRRTYSRVDIIIVALICMLCIHYK